MIAWPILAGASGDKVATPWVSLLRELVDAKFQSSLAEMIADSLGLLGTGIPRLLDGKYLARDTQMACRKKATSRTPDGKSPAESNGSSLECLCKCWSC